MIEKLRGLRLTTAAELVESALEETLTYYAFSEEHWRRIRTNNPPRRVPREIRRRTRVVGAFPDGQSAPLPPPGYAILPDRLVEQTLSEHRIKTASHTVAENDFQIAKRLEAIDSNVNELYRKTHTSFG